MAQVLLNDCKLPSSCYGAEAAAGRVAPLKPIVNDPFQVAGRVDKGTEYTAECRRIRTTTKVALFGDTPEAIDQC